MRRHARACVWMDMKTLTPILFALCAAACSKPTTEATTTTAATIAPATATTTAKATAKATEPATGAVKETAMTPTELAEPAYTLAVPYGTAAADVKLACPDGTKQTRIDTEIACRRFAPESKGAVPPKQGTAVTFHANGAMASQGAYADNRRNGVWVDWDDQGHKVAVKTWKDGAQDGLAITRWPSGKRQSQIEYAAGAIHGTSTTWGDDGKPLAIKRYERGAIVETVAFDSDGKPRKL